MSVDDAIAIADAMRREHKEGAEAFVHRQIMHFSGSGRGGAAVEAWLKVANALQVDSGSAAALAGKISL